MIKVNFNQKKADPNTSRSTGLAPTGTSQFFSQVTELITESQSLLDTATLIKFIVNCAIVISFPVGLKIYEVREIEKLETQKNQEEGILNQKNQELAELQKELKNYDYLDNLAEEFKVKRAFLDQIASDRLLAPRVIDFIQNQIPEDTWLNKLQITLEKEDIKLSLSGFSIKEANINKLTDNLEGILHRKSISVDTKDIKEGQSDTIAKTSFNLKGSINPFTN